MGGNGNDSMGMGWRQYDNSHLRTSTVELTVVVTDIAAEMVSNDTQVCDL